MIRGCDPRMKLGGCLWVYFVSICYSPTFGPAVT